MRAPCQCRFRASPGSGLGEKAKSIQKAGISLRTPQSSVQTGTGRLRCGEQLQSLCLLHSLTLTTRLPQPSLLHYKYRHDKYVFEGLSRLHVSNETTFQLWGEENRALLVGTEILPRLWPRSLNYQQSSLEVRFPTCVSTDMFYSILLQFPFWESALPTSICARQENKQTRCCFWLRGQISVTSQPR